MGSGVGLRQVGYVDCAGGGQVVVQNGIAYIGHMRSPNGTSLRIAAAAPVIPWTDLVYAIAPNGRSSANGISTIAGDTTPVGVFKASVANAIFAAAQLATGPGQPASDPFVTARPEGYVAPAGTDPDADVTHWVARSDAGEPYTDGDTKAIVDLMERFHSAYGIDDSSTPPPLFVCRF